MGPADNSQLPFYYTNTKGVTYYLNKKAVTLRGGKKIDIRYFTKDIRPETAEYELGEEFVINENPRNGFLTVRKIEVEQDLEEDDCDCCDNEADEADDYPTRKEQPDIYTERRTIVEQVKTRNPQTKGSSDDPIDSDYNVTTVRYGYNITPSEYDNDFYTKPTTVEFARDHEEMSGFQGAKSYTRVQLEAHIKNLLTILEEL